MGEREAEGHGAQQVHRSGDVADLSQLQCQEGGEAGVAQRARDRRLHGELGFEPRDSSLVIDSHKAAQALVVAATGKKQVRSAPWKQA